MSEDINRHYNNTKFQLVQTRENDNIIHKFYINTLYQMCYNILTVLIPIRGTIALAYRVSTEKPLPDCSDFPCDLMPYVVDKLSRYNHRKKPIDNVKDINQQILLCCGLSCLPQRRLHEVLIQGYVAAVSVFSHILSSLYILFIHVSMCYGIKLSSAKTLKIITWILCA